MIRDKTIYTRKTTKMMNNLWQTDRAVSKWFKPHLISPRDKIKITTHLQAEMRWQDCLRRLLDFQEDYLTSLQPISHKSHSMPLVTATNHLTLTKKMRISWTHTILELQTIFKAIVSRLIKWSKRLPVWITMPWSQAHNHWRHRTTEVKSTTEKIQGLSTQALILAITPKLNLEVTHEITPKLSNVQTMKETSTFNPTNSSIISSTIDRQLQILIGILRPTLPVKRWTSHRSLDHPLP